MSHGPQMPNTEYAIPRGPHDTNTYVPTYMQTVICSQHCAHNEASSNHILSTLCFVWSNCLWAFLLPILTVELRVALTRSSPQW